MFCLRTGNTIAKWRCTTLNHQKPSKWITCKTFLGTQRVLLLIGCCVLILGTAAYLALSPAPKANTPAEGQQDETLQEAQQQAQSNLPMVPDASDAEPTDADPESEPVAEGSEPIEKPSSTTPRQAQMQMQKPVEGEVLRAFSGEQMVYNKTLNAWSTHNGIDIAAQEGSAVVAALPGEVSEAKADSTLGYVVTIDHSDGRQTRYAGLKEISVKQGDKVNAAQQIGSSGTPPFEADLGPHLHFEYRKDGKYIDPAEALGIQ